MQQHWVEIVLKFNIGLNWFMLKLKLRLSNLALFASNFGSYHALFSYFYGGWGQQTTSGSNSEAQ